jgi:hypothetical protein
MYLYFEREEAFNAKSASPIKDIGLIENGRFK